MSGTNASETRRVLMFPGRGAPPIGGAETISTRRGARSISPLARKVMEIERRSPGVAALVQRLLDDCLDVMEKKGV